jgi:integrase
VATIIERERKPKREGAPGEKYYTAIVRVAGAPSKSASFDRKTDAKAWAQQTEAAIRERRYFPNRQAERRTLADAIDKFLAERVAGLRDARNRRRHLEWWKAQHGHLKLAAITSETVVGWRAEIAGTGNAPATVNQKLAAVRRVLSLAAGEWGWMHRNPTRGVSKLAEPAGRVRFLTDDERGALLTACKASRNPQLYPLVMLALATGARRGELLGLRWGDVDLRGATDPKAPRAAIILRETKNGETRTVPVTGPAVALLKAKAGDKPDAKHHVFPHAAGAEKPADPHEAWNNAVEKAGVPDFRFHDLRHTTASYLAMNGATTAEIAHVLGHKTLQMVKRYSHLSEQHTAGVLERMTGKVFGARS